MMHTPVHRGFRGRVGSCTGKFHGKVSLFMGAQENSEIAGFDHCSSDPCDAGCLCLAVATAALDRPLRLAHNNVFLAMFSGHDSSVLIAVLGMMAEKFQASVS